MASCSDDDVSLVSGTDEMLELTLRFPEMERQAVGSRSVAIPDVDDIWAVFCASDGKVLSTAEIDLTAELEKVLSEGVTCYKLRLVVPEGAAGVALVANAASEMASVTAGDDLSDISFSTLPADESAIPMYGIADLATLQSTIKPQISLERIIAKTTVSYMPATETDYSDLFTDFEIDGVEGFNFATEGWLVPVEPLTQSNQTGCLGLNYGKTEFYSFETSSKNAPRLVLKTNKGYYPVDYLDKDGNKLDVIRNHNYIVTVTQVNAMGYTSESEALKAPAENRLTVLIEDYHAEIYNMIACKDYELGVCDDVTVISTAETAEISVVATEIPGVVNAVPQISWSNENSWIKEYRFKTTAEYSSVDYNSDGKLYTIEFSLDGNIRSQEPRNAEITVRYGDLERTVTITQEGHNFFRDDNRIVLLQHLKSASDQSTIAYFEFVDNTLHGVTPEQNGGRVRNSGLHFSTTENSYVYYIPNLDGDRLTMPSNPKFTVSDQTLGSPSGHFWVVTLNDNASVSDTWTSYFTITNSDGIDIVYDVYRTGIFHEITSDNSHLLDNSKAGWYYYEQIKTSNGVIMLDRNLGADCNQFYTFSVSSLAQYEGAVGAYYRIAESKADGQVTSQICPEGFIIPTNLALENLGIEAVSMSAFGSQTYYAYTIQANGVDGQSQNAYVPVSGYYEGDIHKNIAHACLWTSSPLSGNQGFSTSSPEYGYWYIYLDINGRSVKMSNMRFVNGSAGQSMESGFKYMPVRCVKNDVTQPTAKRTIYYTDTNPWGKVRAYYWGGSSTVEWPGKDMIQVSDNRYKLDIPLDAEKIVFNNGNLTSIGDNDYANKTGDITLTSSSEYGYYGAK